jgi:hypothetical protein
MPDSWGSGRVTGKLEVPFSLTFSRTLGWMVLLISIELPMAGFLCIARQHKAVLSGSVKLYQAAGLIVFNSENYDSQFLCRLCPIGHITGRPDRRAGKNRKSRYPIPAYRYHSGQMNLSEIYVLLINEYFLPKIGRLHTAIRRNLGRLTRSGATIQWTPV